MQEQQGFSITTYTGTGVDARTPTDHVTGNVSLVAPNVVYTYTANGSTGIITSFRNSYVSYDQIVLSFLPEPGRLGLLAIGLLGLFALSRLRRR